MKVHLSIPGRDGTGEFREVTSPYSGEVLAEVEQADAEAIRHVLDLQTGLLDERANWLPLHERTAILRRTAALMSDRAEELAKGIASEGGKPLTDARIEVARAINGTELCAEEAARLAGEEIPMGATAASVGRLAFTTREPIGIVAAVSAFNHPLNLIVHQVGPAVAAGCPVAVKPASSTPLSCLTYLDLLRDAGLPEGWAVGVPCPGRVAEHLVTSPLIRFFSFIGSGEVGWGLRSRLAAGVRCGLEHGGSAPMIVDASADLDRVVPMILKGGYYHAGQVCVSVQRVFALDEVKDALVARLSEAVPALRVGDPLDADTEVGPLIEQSEVDRVHEWVEEAVAEGAKLATGGHPLDHQCYAPTLLVDTPPQARARSEEVFGPVVNVIGVADLDEAIDSCNELPLAFQAAVCTQDVDRALDAARRIDATAVMINDHTAFRVDWMPFGGRGPSGLGLGGIPHSLSEYTQTKMVVFKGR